MEATAFSGYHGFGFRAVGRELRNWGYVYVGAS